MAKKTPQWSYYLKLLCDGAETLDQVEREIKSLVRELKNRREQGWILEDIIYDGQIKLIKPPKSKIKNKNKEEQ